MTDKELKMPLYAKAIFFIILLCALVAISYLAKGIIIPLVFAVIIAIVLHPVVNFLVRIKLNRVVAIIISLILTIVIIAAFSTFLYSQVNRFSESFPIMIDKFIEILNNAVVWISGYFDITPQRITQWIKSTDGELINTSTSAVGHTIVTLGSVMVLMLLIPVYIFMILFYKPLLVEFFRRLFGTRNRDEVSEIITQIRTLIQGYLIGLLIETAIIAALYSIGLLILGIEYAIVLGIIGAMLNLIPYIGSWLAASLPMMIAIVTKSSPWVALIVLAMYFVIQFIDNNFIVPKIVASKVKINALISILSVVAFGTLWGIPGMLVAIPLTAIMKLIFDHIKPLKPLGFLLGDTMPALAIFKVKLLRK